MLVYIYKEYISEDKDLIDDKIFDLLCCEIKDISHVESQVEYEDVEEEECTLEEIEHYVENGYVWLK